MTSGINAKGRFGKQDFVYVADDNTWRCPAGERLTSRVLKLRDFYRHDLIAGTSAKLSTGLCYASP